MNKFRENSLSFVFAHVLEAFKAIEYLVFQIRVGKPAVSKIAHTANTAFYRFKERGFFLFH